MSCSFVIAGWLLLSLPAPVPDPAVPGAAAAMSPLRPVERILLDQAWPALAGWVEARTAYRPPPRPALMLESRARLKQRCFPAFPAHLAPEVESAYDPRTATIYLPDDFAVLARVDHSYLLHEVVHHFQLHDRADERVPCRGRLEGEAIRLQLAWLRDQGEIAPYRALGIDRRTLRIIEHCAGPGMAAPRGPTGAHGAWTALTVSP